MSVYRPAALARLAFDKAGLTRGAVATALGGAAMLLGAGMAVSSETPLPTSSELLKQGFAPVDEGDLLMQSSYSVFRMPVIGDAGEGSIFGARHEHDTFVRLRRGQDEFVCILGSGDSCHRVREQARSDRP